MTQNRIQLLQMGEEKNHLNYLLIGLVLYPRLYTTVVISRVNGLAEDGADTQRSRATTQQRPLYYRRDAFSNTGT